MRRDILIRNRLILKLYRKGVPRKQIPKLVVWIPEITYDTVRKALNCGGIFEWRTDRRKKPRPE